MIEVIVVIILLGIIAGIGAEMISKMYMNYIQARTVNYLQSQSDITVEQIAKRLQYRIKDTAIARNTGNGDIRALNDAAVGVNHNVIEWIGYSNEAMLGNPPGWSGFIDIDSPATSSAAGTLSTPGSNLGNAYAIMNVLGGGQPALIFKQKPAGFNVNSYGWFNGVADPNYVVQVNRQDDNTFDIVGANPSAIFEHYYLAHTAYAIVQTNVIAQDDFTLELRYNYQPWNGGVWNSAGTTRAILATNVNLFRIRQVGNTVRIKLCLHDAGRSGAGRNLVACKEEVIF